MMQRIMEKQHVYSIKSSLGSCIIFNMEIFKDNQFPRRYGTEFDKNTIKETFTKFGYKVYPVQNPSKADIEVKMTEGTVMLFFLNISVSDNCNNNITFFFFSSKQLTIIYHAFA